MSADVVWTPALARAGPR